MKTPIILASLLIIISQSSFANQPENKPRPDITTLASQLQLDENKTQQLEQMMQSFHAAMKIHHQKKQQDREKMHSMREQHHEQLLTILDHQQLYQLELYMHQFKPQGRLPKDSE
ncbi:MAG: hypothetical protein ACI9KN_000715 [Gammaproteobacteria bacterium]|jgi:hypothetical protein